MMFILIAVTLMMLLVPEFNILSGYFQENEY